MKNALYVSLTILSLVGCGKLKQASQDPSPEATRYAVSSNRSLKQASDDISGSIGDIYTKFDEFNTLCSSTEASINEFNENLVAAQAALGPLTSALENNRAFVEPFQISIEANNLEIATKQGQIVGYENILADLNKPATYQAKVKERRKSLRNALNAARRDLGRAYRDLRQAKAPSQKFDDAVTAVSNAKLAISYNKGQLSTVRDTITGQVEAMKTETNGLRSAAQLDITRLRSENEGFSNIIRPFLTAIVNQEAQLAAIPTVDGLRPYQLPAVCQTVSN